MLASQATASLVDGDLRDLGEHRFKDLLAAERVYQLGSRDFRLLSRSEGAACPSRRGRFSAASGSWPRSAVSWPTSGYVLEQRNVRRYRTQEVAGSSPASSITHFPSADVPDSHGRARVTFELPE